MKKTRDDNLISWDGRQEAAGWEQKNVWNHIIKIGQEERRIQGEYKNAVHLKYAGRAGGREVFTGCSTLPDGWYICS